MVMAITEIQTGDNKIALFNLVREFRVQVGHAISAPVLFCLRPVSGLGSLDRANIKIHIENVPEEEAIDFEKEQITPEEDQPQQATAKTDFEPTLESVIEAVLFASDESLTAARISNITDSSTKQVNDAVKELNKKYQVSLVGEGGEYETLVLDAPFFKKKIRLVQVDKFWENNSGYLLVKKAKLVCK